MFRFRVAALLIAAGLAPLIHAADVISEEPTGALTLPEAWGLTLMHNPRLRVFSLEVRAAEARQLQASLRPNPTLEIEVEDFGGSGSMSGFDAAETSLLIRQPLELGGKREKRMQTAAVERALADVDYGIVRGEVRAELAKAFADLLAAQERAELYGEMAGVSERGLEIVRRRMEAGKDAPPELTRASVAHSSVLVRREQARQDLETARRQVASFWGSTQPRFERAKGEPVSSAPLPAMETLRERLAGGPQWTRLEKEIDRRQAMLEEAGARAKPDISIGAGVKRFSETDENALIVGIEIPLPIFDRNQGGRQEARINVTKAAEAQREGQIELLCELDRLYGELVNTRRRIDSLQAAALPGAEEVLEASQRAYAEGKTDYLHVLDAQRTLFEVKNEFIESRAAYQKAQAELERLVGDAATEEIIQDETGKDVKP